MSKIDPLTIKAYLETDYCVDAPEPFVLRIGVASAPLAKLCAQHRADCCTFITACNPYSRRTEEQRNAERMADLAQELKRRGLTFFPGEGRHSAGDWPAEASYLVLGLSPAAARELGETYQQNAVVWCGENAIPELMLLR